ncbi:RNA dependent RNA polymerase-domain-containing protein [Mycena galopus ATCC 62051]|nr:RNA dependent RNA polymerase-domain-containing protein [Mycena galopus ATCC 62051]
MSKVLLSYLPTTAEPYDVNVSIAQVLHSEDFRAFAKDVAEPIFQSDNCLSERRLLLNFKVELNQSTVGITRNDGSGILILPSEEVRTKFLNWVIKQKNPVKVLGKKVNLRPYGSLWEREAVVLSKTPYVDPAIERRHQEKVWALHEALRVDIVQFGFYYRDYPSKPIPDNRPAPPRKFSTEWEREYFSTDSVPRGRSDSSGPPSGVAWLRFDYTHKLICIQLGDENTEYRGSNINVTFASICKIAVGYDPQPYICFDTLTPPVLEGIKFHQTVVGDDLEDTRKSKTRIGSLEPGHLRVCPYAQQLRIVLYNDTTRDMIKVFNDLCVIAGLPQTILVRFNHPFVLEASKREFFTAKRLYRLSMLFRTLDWTVAFQLESLLHNALLQTDEIDQFIPQIQQLVRKKGPAFVGQFLQEFHWTLRIKPLRESPSACFSRILKTYVYHPISVQPGTFNCCQVTVMPTRLILDGPYPIQSNRIIRQYQEYEENFLRVDFRDEDKLQYRWAREVDGSSFVRERVGEILKNGLVLGGRTFEFLAYSTSALRGHAVWFMNPFRDQTGVWITSEMIRKNIGDFAGTPLLKCPSKYAARLAQAFSATDPSVKIGRHQWEEVPDLIVPGHENDPKLHSKFVYTDGVGTIARKLSDMIWKVQCDARHDKGKNSVQPSAYQIRFLGYKGVVSVDEELDDHPDGILMRLRPSMKKFESDKVQAMNAEIEIAMSFGKPNTAYLNRPLVMALEDRGVRKTAFVELQDKAVAAARTIHDSISQFREVLQEHTFGNNFRLSFILDSIEKLGFDLQPKHRTPGVDSDFLRQLRQVAENDVLRDIKHSARIPIPESYLLVGVSDEGPAYKKAGYSNVYELPPGKIYACIHRREDEEPRWLEGSCTISRSPIIHLGDVQRVQAIGKPPEGMLCLFAGLKNVVVLSSIDPKRSLASCLAGGDLDVPIPDSDMYTIIQYPPLLPPNQEEPAEYPDGATLTLARDSTVDDICNFIIEYINSDVLGLLSLRLLVLADQSKEGMYDNGCRYLAELCSQAVDYPKQGIPVDLDNISLPRKLIRCSPDWHAAEVVSPRETDYYPSEKALGVLFRAIILDDPEPISSDDAGVASTVNIDPASNPIFSTLARKIEQSIPDFIVPDGTCTQTRAIFRKYVDELRYISMTHTLTTEPGINLLEAEIVVGTILAKSAQKRWRSDCIYRMRYHATAVIRDIQMQIFPREQGSGDSAENLRAGLERAWIAWDFSLRHEKEFGAKSFGLIALAIVFDCVDTLLP